MRSPRRTPAAVACALLLLGAVAGCGSEADDGPSVGSPEASSTSAQPGTATKSARSEKPERPRPSKSKSPKPKPRKPPAPFGGRRVLVVSVDGLNPEALRQLGPEAVPALGRLVNEGASTLNARTEVERTDTLPNHTGMVTGLRIDRAAGGHGVVWNDERPGSTVHSAAGREVSSIFSIVKAAGGTTAVFASKPKFALFERSWPDAIDRDVILGGLPQLVGQAATDLVEQRRTFTFVHLAQPDFTGHARGFMSADYLDAVEIVDGLVGQLLDVIAADRELRRSMAVVLVSDHGGLGPNHVDPAAPANYTIPLAVWGRDVPTGDLYAVAPAKRDPGTARPPYLGAQPVRNCDVANLAADLLSLDPVPGSQCATAGEYDFE